MSRPSQLFLDGPIYKAIAELATLDRPFENQELIAEIEELIDAYADARGHEIAEELAEIQSLEDDNA